MRQDGKIDYIEFPGADLPAIKDFYRQAFGWTFVDYGPAYAAFDNGGVDGGFNGDADDQAKAPLVVDFYTFQEASLA
jgi:predicted enzyme related to lactoylglutathione lyase